MRDLLIHSFHFLNEVILAFLKNSNLRRARVFILIKSITAILIPSPCYLFSGSRSSPFMNMLAVGVEGDIGADEDSGAAADIIFSVSIEAEAISVLLCCWC